MMDDDLRMEGWVSHFAWLGRALVAGGMSEDGEMAG